MSHIEVDGEPVGDSGRIDALEQVVEVLEQRVHEFSRPTRKPERSGPSEGRHVVGKRLTVAERQEFVGLLAEVGGRFDGD